MIKVAMIVEGYGDVQAFPILLGRTGERLGQVVVADNPIRVGDWTALKAKGDLPKYLEVARTRECDMIVVALDLDDGCPVTEAQIARAIIENWRGGREIIVEVAFFNREHETMFLLCPEEITSHVGALPANAEAIRDAKGALKAVMGRRYKETQDQAAFSRRVNLQMLFTRSRPYRRLCRAISGCDYDLLEIAFS